ncbi:MAG: ABC transporter substrate-binding protein [Ilumatobacteraceae bacterium]
MSTPHARRCLLAATVAAAMLLLAGCADATSVAVQEFTPRAPGDLVVATAFPAPGFWEGATAATADGGFEWALATALADRLGLRLRVVNAPFDDLAAGRFGDADVAIAQISITNDRRTRMELSSPYYTTDAAVLVRDGDDVADLKAARELRWAVVAGTTGQDVVNDRVRPIATVQAVADEGAAADAVAAGTVDAALLDLPTALALAHDTAGLEVVARVATTEEYAIASPLGDTRNAEAVDAAVRAFERDGTLDALAEQWLEPVFGVNPADLPTIRIR